METWLISTDPEPRIEAWQLFDSGVSMINVDAGQADARADRAQAGSG